MWKKTGAWFFKGIPRYELPARNTNTRSSMRELRSRPERINKFCMKVDDSSSEDDKPSDNNHHFNSQQQTKQQQHQTDNSILRRVGSLRIRSSSLSRSINNVSPEHSSINNVTMSLSRKTSPLELYSRQSTIPIANVTNDYQNGPNSINTDWETESVSGCGSSSKRECNGANSSSGGGSLIRCGSVSSSWSMSETSSGNSSTMTTAGHGQMCREPPLGWLEVSLLYSEADHALDCTMIRARDLPPMNSASTADPFCKLNIVTEYGTTKQKKWLQTKTVHKTRSPEFNETVRFFGVEPEELGVSTLYVVLLDDDKFGHDFLGAAKILLGPVRQTN